MRLGILGTGGGEVVRREDLLGFGFEIARGLGKGSRLNDCIDFYFFSVLIFLILLLRIIVEFLGFHPPFDLLQELWLVSSKQRVPEGVSYNFPLDFSEPIDIELY